MLRNLNKSSGGKRILGTPSVGLLASQIIAETAAGDSGAGLLYNEAQANTGKQLRCIITGYTGTPSKLFVYENGSFLSEGEANGSYTISYNVLADNVLLGSDTAILEVGITHAAALGGTGVSTVSGAGGGFTSNALVAVVTGVSTITGAGGTATGVIAGVGAALGGEGASTLTGTGGTPATGAGVLAATGIFIVTGSGGTALGVTGKAATIKLVNTANAAQASLSGLKWAWFDQTSPDAFTAPTDKGVGESTDASGFLTVQIPNSSKTSGQVGWLVVTDSDGTTLMPHKAFSGPVAVT